MNDIDKEKLMELAKRKHGEIFPVGSSKSLDNGFQEDGGRKMFWFNTSDNSTRMIVL